MSSNLIMDEFAESFMEREIYSMKDFIHDMINFN